MRLEELTPQYGGSGVPFSAFAPFLTRMADAYASRFLKYGALRKKLASSVREILGLARAALSDDEAIRLVLDPGKNRLLGETLTLTTHGKLSRALFHPSYTFRKKLSHTADSQDQRHRMTPASRPALRAYLSDEPDYIVPMLVPDVPEADEQLLLAATLLAMMMERVRH